MKKISYMPYLIVFKDNSFCKYKPYLEFAAVDNQDDFIIVYTAYDDVDYLWNNGQVIEIPEVNQSINNLYEYLLSIINENPSNV